MRTPKLGEKYFGVMGEYCIIAAVGPIKIYYKIDPHRGRPSEILSMGIDSFSDSYPRQDYWYSFYNKIYETTKSR